MYAEIKKAHLTNENVWPLMMRSSEILLHEMCYFTTINCFTVGLLVVIQFLIYLFNVFSHSLAPLYENQCSYIQATVAHFLHWTRGQKDVGPFSEYSCLEYWAYADYKYIAMLFHDQPSMFEVIILPCFVGVFPCMKMSV